MLSTWILASLATSAYAQQQSSGNSSAASSHGAHHGGGGGGGGGGPDVESWIYNYILVTWGSIALAFIVYEIATQTNRYIRKVVCLNNETQRYFAVPNETFGNIKKYILDAPLFRYRHHREFRLSSAVNIGTLPSRFQSFFLAVFLMLNIVFMCWRLEWSLATAPSGTERLGLWYPLVSRSGHLAVLNMIPLFIFAGRNNPLLVWTSISFDTFNLFHRWLGRIATAEALIHFIFWMVAKVQGAETPQAGWQMVASSFGSSMIYTGTVAFAAWALISIQALSPIRHAFYEFFLHFHVVLVIVSVIALSYHVNDNMASLNFLKGAIVIWVLEHIARVLRIAYRNWGSSGSKALVEILPGDALRLTVQLARPWDFKPGQHAYVYMPRIGWWTNHPFTLAWSEESGEDITATEKNGLVRTRQDVLGQQKSSVSMIVRRRTGFTDKLFRYAEQQGGAGKVTLSAWLEGPYGNQSFRSYGTVLLFAAGIGITHSVPHVRDLVAGFGDGTGATRKVTLVWIIQSPEHLEWIRPWMTKILGMPRRRDVLKILLFVTRPRSTKEIHSPSASVQMFPGKPSVRALVDAAVEERVGAMCVSVCGTGSLADDARAATRRWMGVASVDFEEESFSW